MFAIVEIAGKQYKVTSGSQISVDNLNLAAKEAYTIDKVLLTANEDGSQTKIGAPYLDLTIPATVIDNAKGEKVTVFKFKPKTRYAKKQGHRQNYTILEVGTF